MDTRATLIRDLQLEVFESTGMMVSKDDPIVSAALVQSRLIKKTAESLYADLSVRLEDETNLQVEKINSKINEHIYYVDERIEELRAISKELIQSKEAMLSEVTLRSQQVAIKAIKDEMIPLMSQYSAYKVYGIAALIGVVSGCIPIFLMFYLKS